MRKVLFLMALCFAPCWAEVWKFHDKAGNEARVEHPGVPSTSKALASAYRSRFFPDMAKLKDPEFRIDYETTVTPGLKSARVYSLAGSGLILYKDGKGNVIGAHPTKVFHTLTWDLRKNRAVKLADLVRADAKKQLWSVLNRYADMPDGLNQDWGLDFYLRKDGVAFYQPDAPHAVFGLEFVVPYKELRPLAAPGSPLLDPSLISEGGSAPLRGLPPSLISEGGSAPLRGLPPVTGNP